MLVLYCIISSLLLLITLENTIYNKNTILKSFKNNFIAYLCNLFIIFSINIYFSIVFRNLFVRHMVLFIIFAFIGVLNYQMLYYRKEYFKPIDLKLFKESIEISENIEIKIPKTLYLYVIINIIFSIFLFITKINLVLSIKSPVFIATMILFIAFLFFIQSEDFCNKVLKIKIDKYSDFGDFKNNGFLFSFFRNLHTFKLKEPDGYKSNMSYKMLHNVLTSKPEKKPNIIIIMNESFFNVNEVQDLHLSKNPLPTFDKIIEDFTNGNVISPVIGGGTCQPEYEMLTGNSVIFTYKYKIAFLEFFKYIKKRSKSIISVLNDLDYSNRFIHPYRKEFYNRLNAYTCLGIDKIIDIKNFENAYCPRDFVSDKDCYNKVINEYENRDTNKPFFSIVVTMQNHPGYLKGEKFFKHNINVLNGNISVDEKTMLENYVNLLKESDDAIEYITNYFSDKEDTVIMFFGDHQPTENIGFSSISNRNDLELSRTPFFIWDNYGLDKKDYGDVGSFYLSAILLDHINIKSDEYFNYLFEQLPKVKSFNTSFIIDGENNYINRKNVSIDIKETLSKLELLQFDRL